MVDIRGSALPNAAKSKESSVQGVCVSSNHVDAVNWLLINTYSESNDSVNWLMVKR